jgi:hypothetical protein
MRRRRLHWQGDESQGPQLPIAPAARSLSRRPTIRFVFSTQEEFRLRGALLAAQALAPDIATLETQNVTISACCVSRKPHARQAARAWVSIGLTVHLPSASPSPGIPMGPGSGPPVTARENDSGGRELHQSCGRHALVLWETPCTACASSEILDHRTLAPDPRAETLRPRFLLLRGLTGRSRCLFLVHLPHQQLRPSPSRITNCAFGPEPDLRDSPC